MPEVAFQPLVILLEHLIPMPGPSVEVGNGSDMFERPASFDLVCERDGSSESASL